MEEQPGEAGRDGDWAELSRESGNTQGTRGLRVPGLQASLIE